MSPRAWTARRWLGLSLLALALAVAAWIWARPAPLPIARPGEARPALWLIEKGGRRALLFGTVHILPRDARWITPRMAQAMARTDRLILEAWNLDDRDATQAIFSRLGTAARPVPFARRLPPGTRWGEALDKAGLPRDALDRYESWAAAIILSARLLPDGDGVEPALTRFYRRAGKPVEGLETVEQQFGYLDRLPTGDQDRFLSETITQSGQDAALFAKLYSAWAGGNLRVLTKAFTEDLDDAPALRDALLVRRNRAWATEIDRRLPGAGTPLIAVGTAHLVGPDSLLDRLVRQGYTLRRLQ